MKIRLQSQLFHRLKVNLHVPHSFRVEFYIFTTRVEWSFTSFPLVSSVVSPLKNSGLRACKALLSHGVAPKSLPNPTRFECSFTSSPLVSSVVSHLLHSFRVCFFTQFLLHVPQILLQIFIALFIRFFKTVFHVFIAFFLSFQNRSDLKTTLETSGEDVKTTLETSGEDVKTTLETSGED